MWSTYQHYCLAGSRPDIVGATLDDLLAEHELVPRDGRFGALIAQAVAGQWQTVCLIDAVGNRIGQRVDPERYDVGRRVGWSLKPSERLVDTTPPSFTRWVGRVE